MDKNRIYSSNQSPDQRTSTFIGGYVGWRIGKMWDKIPQIFWGLAVGVSIAITVILFWEYIYTSAISYGDS
ncbi:hypothetical protein [Pseudanabaena yagii]|uniref:Uncharacterized protein n=1 Tax=Pseudanabaena yagii GIHE-NHR1 TaxID=2722753 RepID=A0ABX1LTE2_9CYAN|nr:hypothetical protein [Pseudanabaena yagii]NMF59433.1 hypothetical protein [Pseudanabaena yagii GIHE-NHR1]